MASVYVFISRGNKLCVFDMLSKVLQHLYMIVCMNSC